MNIFIGVIIALAGAMGFLALCRALGVEGSAIIFIGSIFGIVWGALCGAISVIFE